MKTEDELLIHIGNRIKSLRDAIDKAKSRLEREKLSAVLQEYKELLEFYITKEEHEVYYGR